MIKIGFTGTRNGMTYTQKKVLVEMLDEKTNCGINEAEFHHGDCMGADAEAHALFIPYLHEHKRKLIIIHPPISDMYRAQCFTGSSPLYHPWIYVLETKTPLARNHDIVNVCDVLIGCPPNERGEIKRSGTWATIRFARKKHKAIIIIRPSGKVSYE